MRFVISLFAICFQFGFLYSQTDAPSLAEMKENYFTKRSSFASSSTKKFTTDQQTQLNALVDQLKASDPESFEYNLVMYINSNYNTAFQENLFKAYALNSSDETTVKEMLAFYIITSNTAKQKEFLTKVQKFYTAAELSYYADALPGGKGMLITSNQEDYFGFLSAQTVHGLSTETQIVCMDLMKNDSYREMVSNNAGISDQSFLGNERTYLKSILSGSSKKIYVSCTVPQDYLGLVSESIFITGLYYQYGSVDQFSLLESFWKKIKTKDISALSLTKSSENKLYGNYLAPLITLYVMKPEDVVLKSTIQAIAKKVGREKEVEEIMTELGVN